MFSFLTKAVARIATPIIAPIIRPAIAHAVGYFQPIESEFEKEFRTNNNHPLINPVAVGIAKVVKNVDIVRKKVEAVVKAPVDASARVVEKSIGLAKLPIIVTSRVVDHCQQKIAAVVKTPFVITSRAFNKSVELVTKLKIARDEPIAFASKIVKEVVGVTKHFVPSSLLRYVHTLITSIPAIFSHMLTSYSTIRTNIGIFTKTTHSTESWWVRPDETKLDGWLSTDHTRASTIDNVKHSVKGTPSSAYPSPPLSVVESSSLPADTADPSLDTAVVSQETEINTSPISEATITPLDIGSPISSLQLGESLGSLTSSVTIGSFTNGHYDNDNNADLNSQDTSDKASVSSPDVQPVNGDLITAGPDVLLPTPPSPTCSSESLSEIVLPNYSPAYGEGSDNTNTDTCTSTAVQEEFSEDEDDAINRARAIAFLPDHEEAARLDGSLEQSPR